jgi:hypothetical protein
MQWKNTYKSPENRNPSILVRKAEQESDLHIHHGGLPISGIRELDSVGVTARSVIGFVNVNFMVAVLVERLYGLSRALCQPAYYLKR